MDDAKLLAQVKRRTAKARRFGDNTCPASRHVQMMGEKLPTKAGYHMLAEEPEHCAISILSTVGSLYEARTRIKELEEWIASEGVQSDTCTRTILGKVCSNCRCSRKPADPPA